MDQFFLRDKFTKSNYQFFERNKCDEIKLSDIQRKKVDQMHVDFENQLRVFHKTFNFNSKKVPKKYSHSKGRDEINIEYFFKNVLIEISVKDQRNVYKLGSESPYIWFVLNGDEARYSIKCLDEKLKKEEFFEKPINWLIKRNIILPSKCTNCKNIHEQYQLINDEYYWICSDKRCMNKKFELNYHLNFASKILKDIPSLIYNWAIYGNSGLLKKSKSNLSTNLDSNMAYLVISTFRLICRETNESFIKRLGKNGKKVELFTSNASNLFIIFAYEIDTEFVKFKIFNNDEIYTIIPMLKEWFDPSVKLVFYENKFNFLKKYFENAQLLSYNEQSSKFSDTIFEMIARNVVHNVMTYDIFESFIHEIIWRNLFGKTPYSAFQFIVSLISKQPVECKFYMFDFVPRTDSNLFVDEVYYGSFEQINRPKMESNAQLRNNIRCHKCFIPHNFISINNHLMSHFTIESKKPEKKLSALNTTCYHCFSKFRFADLQMHRDMLEGNFKRKSFISACKICCKIFKSKNEYIIHLKDFHRYQDQPYSCDLCPFRTSFYNEKLKHYKINHSDIVKAYCKYCLIIFTGENASKELFAHFKLHIDVKDLFKCNRCALSFVSDQQFKYHFLYDHILQSKQSANFVVKQYRPNMAEEKEVLKIKVAKNIQSKILTQRLTRDGSKVKLTKKNFVKLGYENLYRDNILNKDFILINNNFVICLECSQPMDTNHLTKKAMKCDNCEFIGHCVISIKYPCGLHMSGAISQ